MAGYPFPGKRNLTVVLTRESLPIDAEKVFGERKNDHKIINAALKLRMISQSTRLYWSPGHLPSSKG